jgi:hypothetical protein
VLVDNNNVAILWERSRDRLVVVVVVVDMVVDMVVVDVVDVVDVVVVKVQMVTCFELLKIN